MPEDFSAGIKIFAQSTLCKLSSGTISDFATSGGELLVEPGFASIERGQVWRLISPIFVHFGVLHLVFNLWWLKDFGSAIERVFSSTYLLVLVLVFGLTSNVAQYWWVGSPMFVNPSKTTYRP